MSFKWVKHKIKFLLVCLYCQCRYRCQKIYVILVILFGRTGKTVYNRKCNWNQEAIPQFISRITRLLFIKLLVYYSTYFRKE